LLFDAGCHPEAMGPAGRWPHAFQKAFPWRGGSDCHLPNRLKQLGWSPDDFDVVVLSHLHCDHCGCVEFFRRSRLVVHRAEFAAAMGAKARYGTSEGYMPSDIAQWQSLELNWRFVESADGDRDIYPGVRLLNWGPGHSCGMLGLHIRLPGYGGVILASDAVYCQENYGPPVRPQGVMLDAKGWRRTLQSIKELSASTGAAVWFGHDMRQFAGLKLSTEGCYE
jgi:glyoxylase-like metal-dependent hydrolase (beta-lactamase superfamily II)